MKNRIKKFYKDHEEAIWVFTSMCAGAAAAGFVITKMVERDNIPCHLRTWTNQETNKIDFVEVTQRNGKKTLLDYWPDAT